MQGLWTSGAVQRENEEVGKPCVIKNLGAVVLTLADGRMVQFEAR